MSTNKKFRIQNGVDVADGGISINDVTVIGADGKVVPAAIADAVAGLTSTDIADLQAQVSAILGTSPETLDTLQEIVSAFENADSTLTQAVADNTAAHTANTAEIDATNARTAGISTSSGSSNIEMTADVDMGDNNITSAGDVYAARGFIDRVESEQLIVQTGTVDFEGSTVNFGSSTITGGGFGQATKDEIDQHLNQSAAGTNEFLKWNGTDYEFTDYIQGRLATDQITVEGSLKTEQPGSTIDWQDGLVHFGGSQVIVDEPTSPNLAANKKYVDDADSDVTASAAADASVKADAAQAAAEATASADATSKADAAQAAAEATASADATSKADAAEASAKSHADAGDANLQGQIDIIVGSSPASLDTLQEIVTAFENADNTLTGAVASNEAAHQANASAIAAETTRATSKENQLEAMIYNDQSVRDQGDAQNAADIDALEFKTFGSTGNGDPEFPTSQLGGGTPTLWGMVSDNTSAISGLMSSKADKTTVASDIATAKSEAATDATTKADAAEASANAYTDAAETRVANDINVETARAVAVEGSLQSQIDTEQSARISGDQSLQNAVDAEEAARIAGDNANSAEVAAEEAARIAADAVLQSAITAEASTRAGADNTLQSNIDTVSAAVSAITNGSPETLNQLTELVAAYEGADQSLQTLIDNLGGDASALTGRVSTLEAEMDATEAATSSNSGAISAEEAARIAGDAANSAEVTAEAVARSAADDDLQDAIDAEASARAAAVSAETSARQNAITAETNARILADNGLQSQIDALDNSTTGDKSNLQAQITSNDNDIAALQSRAGTIEADYATQASLNAEISRATTAEGVNAAAISDEETRATAAEQANAFAIAQEVVDRQNADAVLQGQIDFIEENTDPAALDSLTEIVAAFQAADGSITGVVNSNTSRISALETGVTAIEAWDTDNVSEGSTNLYFTEARAKACVGADAGSCLDYNQTSGKFSLDLSETAGALVPDNSSNADKLDGQHGSHYRIDVYDVNGTVVN